MRVLVVISNLEQGGAQRQFVELYNAVDPQTCELHLCSLSQTTPLAPLLRDTSRYHVLPRRWKFDLSVVTRLVELIRRLRIDVVHGVLFDAEIATRLAGRRARVRAVIGSERNADYEVGRLPFLAYRLTRNMVDLVVANSTAGARFNSRYLGHPENIYRIVRNGVDTQRFQPRDRIESRRALGLGDELFVVGTFASLKPQKNHPLLLRAARKVLDRYPHFRFLLVGDVLGRGEHGTAEYSQAVRDLIDELKLGDAVQLLGNRMNLAEIYSACDITALPSLFEGTPNVLLESMACGCPVLATDVADNAIVAPAGKVGLLTPSGDVEAFAAALMRLHDDAAERGRFASQCRPWALQEFSVAAMTQKMLQVYAEAASGQDGRSP